MLCNGHTAYHVGHLVYVFEYCWHPKDEDKFSHTIIAVERQANHLIIQNQGVAKPASCGMVPFQTPRLCSEPN